MPLDQRGGETDATVNPAPSAPPSVPPERTRVALWDNARFWLIVLVVAGHAISTVRTDTAFGFATYAFIYLFHMPAMIALSGLFAKPEASPKVTRSTVQLLVTWLVWELIWAGIHFFIAGRGVPETWLVVPAWTLWFLVTLATMRILLPYLARLRHPLVVSIVIALLAGLSPAIGTAFSASRTLAFLPFFVAAWLAVDRGWFRGEWFLAPSRALRGVAWGFLALVAGAFAAAPELRRVWRIDTWLTWRDDYAWLFAHAPIGDWAPTEWWATALGGASVRLGLLALAAAMTLAVLLVVPRSRSVVTTWGSRTLAVYLLHGPIIWALRGSGAIEWIGGVGTPGVVALLALGAAIAVVLSLGWVSRVTRPVIEPKSEWAFIRSDAK